MDPGALVYRGSPGGSTWATAGLCLPTVDYYFGPPRPGKPHAELETDEEKEELSECSRIAPSVA